MLRVHKFFILSSLISLLVACHDLSQSSRSETMPVPSAAELFGNPDYPGFSYGGYRGKSREMVPTKMELADDMKILSAMGIKIIRTYNTSAYPQAARLLAAIRDLKRQDPDFEMYVMLGAWIESENAWTSKVNHHRGHSRNNSSEIAAAVALAIEYADIVKAIAVGNEAMVQWAVQYFVTPAIILKWVNYLQTLKQSDKLPADLWITSSDNYESWGGGAKHYQTKDLAALIEAVDFVSLHTYPFHESYYNPDDWGVLREEENLTEREVIKASMLRAAQSAMSQYQSTVDYVQSLGLDKPVHIGETGWSSHSGGVYGASGSRAADELKEKLYYQYIRDWTNSAGITCFYFEAFDEQWKNEDDASHSENHFGLFSINNEAKYALWDEVDQGLFDGLTRNGDPIIKSYNGHEHALMLDVLRPPLKREMANRKIKTVNRESVAGRAVTANSYVVLHDAMLPAEHNSVTYPSNELKLNAWEGTSRIEMSALGIIEVATGTGKWWGGGIEIQGGTGENLSNFSSGHLHFDIRGDASATFNIGFQTGVFLAGTQTNNFVSFGAHSNNVLSKQWTRHSVPVVELNRGADLTDVTSVLYLWSDARKSQQHIDLKNIYYTQD